MISSIVFGLLIVAGTGFFIWNAQLIRQNILIGIDVDRSDNKSERFKTMALIALGQGKMFKRPIPAILHLAIYSSFVITQIELIEIFTDGIIGTHRVFRPSLGGFYTFMISLIEILSFLTFLATIAFLWRRNILKVPRLNMKELAGWAKLDANLILLFEIILLTCIFMMNGADEVLYRRGLSHAENLSDGTFGFAISSFLGPWLFGNLSDSGLHIVERIGWWGHICMVFTFLNYLPYSKHFHILLAFPNTFYSNLWPKGQFNNLASVKKEVQLMMDPNADPYAMPAEGEAEAPARFGARDVNDLSWKQLLDSYTCTECGRCTSVCPANTTGKLLSPRKVMMDTRDRLTEYGNNIRKNGKEFDDGKSLHSYITEEELWACTSCNACVDICPVNIDPLSIIVDLRRYLVMEESKAPTELTTMMTNIENNGAPWQFSPSDRMKWAEE
jgi:heterodisulfide reductase subunit C